jgi:hypothetical protein
LLEALAHPEPDEQREGFHLGRLQPRRRTAVGARR